MKPSEPKWSKLNSSSLKRACVTHTTLITHITHITQMSDLMGNYLILQSDHSCCKTVEETSVKNHLELWTIINIRSTITLYFLLLLNFSSTYSKVFLNYFVSESGVFFPGFSWNFNVMSKLQHIMTKMKIQTHFTQTYWPSTCACFLVLNLYITCI